MGNEYKKRAKGGYESDKKASNRSERGYEAKDIEEQLAETNSYKKSKKKLNKIDKEAKKHLKNIHFFEKTCKTVEEAKELIARHRSNFFHKFYQRVLQDYLRAIKYTKEIDLETIQNNNIRRRLEKVRNENN